jgi:hypothetical protein
MTNGSGVAGSVVVKEISSFIGRRKENLTVDEHGNADWLCPKRQFLPLMNTDGLIRRIKFVGRTSTKRFVLISVISANQW